MIREIAILAYEGCWAMSVYSATDFFRVVTLLEAHLGQAASCRVRIVSAQAEVVAMAGGHRLAPDAALNEADAYDLVIVPALEGPRVMQVSPDARLASWLAAQIRQGARILTLTTGASLLAATGQVDGLRLATHWAFVRQLGRRYPACEFVAHKSFVQTGNIYSTGSLNGSFEALLDMLARERGDQFAQLCATHLLVSDPHKLPAILPGHRNHADEAILKVQDWIESHHADVITILQMSQRVGMGQRTLKRRFQQATGLPPNLYLQQVRIDKAKKLLIATSLSVKEVAYEVGYENVSFFVRIFKASAGQTPGQWRKPSASQ